MHKFISQFNIKQRILLSFALILGVSILFTLLSMFSLRNYHQEFTQYKHVSADTNLMLQIDHSLSELQRHILSFSYDYDVVSIAEVKDEHKALSAAVNQLIKQHTFSKASDGVLIRQMQTLVNNFNGQFERLEEQRNRRDVYINGELSADFERVYQAMLLLSTHVGVKQNKILIKDLWEAQLSISEAELISAAYFNSHQFVEKSEVQRYLVLAEDALKEAAALAKNKLVKEEIVQVHILLEQTIVTFNKAVQTDRDYFFLVKIVLADEYAVLNALSEKLKATSLQEQRDIFISAEKNISFNEQTAIYTSLLSVLVAIGLALVVGRYISKPLKLITETFNQLADGQQVMVIPGVGRADEIGDLARAADVFNDANLSTIELLHESERTTAALARRELALEKMNEELNSFTHIASHDLKSPIQGIADLADWIQEDLGDDIPETVKNNLDRIGIRVNRMQTLIDDLLKYSQAGKKSDAISLIEPEKMINEVLELLVIPSGIKISVSGEIAPFESTQTPLQTAIRNLVSNAIKHHDKAEGNINISMGEEGTYYRFDIQDDGPGIAESDQQSVFLLFKTGSKSGNSTGMGLAFCKRMVEAQGGRIELDSQEGNGSTFRVLWPKTLK